MLVSAGDAELAPITRFICSGFLFEARFFTAAHCLDRPDGDRYAVMQGGVDVCSSEPWEISDVEFERVWPSIDVAMMRLAADSGSEPPNLVLGTDNWELGDELVVAGWQQGSRAGLVGCEVEYARLHDCSVDSDFVACEIGEGSVVCSGMSGAPVFRAGRLVGVLSASAGCDHGTAWFGPITER